MLIHADEMDESRDDKDSAADSQQSDQDANNETYNEDQRNVHEPAFGKRITSTPKPSITVLGNE